MRQLGLVVRNGNAKEKKKKYTHLTFTQSCCLKQLVEHVGGAQDGIIGKRKNGLYHPFGASQVNWEKIVQVLSAVPLYRGRETNIGLGQELEGSLYCYMAIC